MALNPDTCDKLKQVSTATLATALFKRGLRNQMIQGVQPLSPPKAESMVGEAYTLRYIPAREDLNDMGVFRNPVPPAAQGGGGVPTRRGDGDRQPQGRPRRLRRRHPGHTADDARRGGHRDRWRLPRFSRDRAGWTSSHTTCARRHRPI